MRSFPALLLAACCSAVGVARAWPQVQTLHQLMAAEASVRTGKDGVLDVPVDAKPEDLDKLHDAGARIMTGKPAHLESPPATAAKALSPVSSASFARLSISPTSVLHGLPNQVVHVDFLLTNLGPDTYFGVSASAEQSSKLLAGLSETKPLVRQNETRTLVLTLRVPADARDGSVATVALEVQPYGNNAAGSTNMMSRRFEFTVGSGVGLRADSSGPECVTAEDSSDKQCKGYTNCAQKKWTARMFIQDSDSGLRSIHETPSVGAGTGAASAFYTHDNFVIGSKARAEYYFSSTCCTTRLTLAVKDVAGNEATCQLGRAGLAEVDTQPETQAASTSGTTIAIIVVVVVLLVALAAAGVALFVMRRKRNAELAEMRATPQAR